MSTDKGTGADTQDGSPSLMVSLNVLQVLGFRDETWFWTRDHDHIQIARGNWFVVQRVGQAQGDTRGASFESTRAFLADVVDFTWSAQIDNWSGETTGREIFWSGHVDQIYGGEIEELDDSREEDADFERVSGGHVGR